MRWTRDRIYNMHLDLALAEGLGGKEAERVAADRTEDDYWELVDRGRQEAKDRQFER